MQFEQAHAKNNESVLLSFGSSPKEERALKKIHKVQRNAELSS